MEALRLNVFYGDFHAVHDVNLQFGKNEITALIGPSGCGKSTVLRCLNRMNDLVAGARVEGEVTYHGQNIYARDVDPIAVRTQIGMVFQKPNPFPKSIYDNIAYGPRVTGMKVDNMDDLVEEALRGAALWDEVKDKLKQSAYGLSGGQQQRLCIARTIATRPDVILMDEPCSALDPIATVADRGPDGRAARRRTRSSSSPTTCSRRPGSPTGPRSSPPARTRPPATAPACWSSSTGPRNIFANPARQAHRGLHLRPLRLSRSGRVRADIDAGGARQ